VELIRDLEAIAPQHRGGVLSVGVFDGVHLGHQKVLGRAVERARDLGVEALVFTFHPHPLGILRPAEEPPLIQTFGQKLELMREMGLAAVVWPRDMVSVLAMAPEVGGDFHFGAGAGGDRRLLERLSHARGLEVEFVADVEVDGRRISSTRIRGLIAAGSVAEAARCLGRPYGYLGTVVEGRHRGTRLGYPTVNLRSPRFLVPGEGVYAGWATVRGLRHAAAISVGRAPTFREDQPVVVEAFLLDFDGELYGDQVALEFVEYLRPQKTFAHPEALRAGMAADCDRVRAILADKAAGQGA